MIAQWIDSFAGQQQMVEDLTRKIAARCEAAVWARVKNTAAMMDAAQARGYIRARSALVVDRELNIATGDKSDLTADLIEQVRRNVYDVLVTKTVASLRNQPAVSLRRAA